MAKRSLSAATQARKLEGSDAFYGGKRRAIDQDRPAAVNSIIQPAKSATRRPNQIRQTPQPLNLSHIVPSVAGNADILTDINTQPDLPTVPPIMLLPELSMFTRQPPHLFMAPISFPVICTWLQQFASFSVLCLYLFKI